MMYSIVSSVIATVPFLRIPRTVVAAVLVAIMVFQPSTVKAEGLVHIMIDKVLDVMEEGNEGVEHGPEVPPTVQDVLLDICETRGYGVDCAKTLLGMASVETDFRGSAIGDRGQARGWFQIWPKLHKKSLERIMGLRHPEIATAVDCAEDLSCSADWTISYLESNGYPKHVTYAVQCHNGCNKGNDWYPVKVKRRAALHWDKEVTITLAAK